MPTAGISRWSVSKGRCSSGKSETCPATGLTLQRDLVPLARLHLDAGDFSRAGLEAAILQRAGDRAIRLAERVVAVLAEELAVCRVAFEADADALKTISGLQREPENEGGAFPASFCLPS